MTVLKGVNNVNAPSSYAVKHFNKRLNWLRYVLKFTNHSKKKQKLIAKIKYNERELTYYLNKLRGD